MEKLLIIAAIIVAVLLLSGSIVPPRRPNFVVSDKLSDFGLSYRISVLGAKCRVTEKGHGIGVRFIVRSIRKSIKSIDNKFEEGVNVEYWERVLSDNSDIITSALKKASRDMRFCYLLGHVGGLPRLFLFCDELVKSSGGQVDGETMYSELKTFSTDFELSYAELKLLKICMIFCLCGYISAWATLAEKRAKTFERGAEDGKNGRLDLDSIRKNDYICGLFCGSGRKDEDAFERIAELNGTDRYTAESNRRIFLARVSAAIEQASLSISELSVENDFPFDYSDAHTVLLKDGRYSAATVDDRTEYLAYVGRYAKARGITETAAASELVNNRTSEEIYDAVFKRRKTEIITALYNILPIFFVILTFFLLIYFKPRFYPVFCLLSLFTVTKGVYVLLSAVFGDILEKSERYFEIKDGKTMQIAKQTRSVIFDLTPFAELIGILTCAYAFSSLGLFVAAAVVISDVLSCLFLSASRLSVKPIFGGMNDVIRFLLEPPISIVNLFSEFISKKDVYETVCFISRFSIGVTVIAFSAIVSGSAATGIIGGFILLGSVSPSVFVVSEKLSRRIAAKRRKREIDGKSVAVKGSVIPSARFFGGETEYKKNVFRSESVEVSTDNLGAIHATFLSDDGIDFDIGLTVTDGDTIDTEMCFGAFFRHGSVYKYVNERIEISTEIIAPIGCKACLCRVTAINRMDETRTIELGVKCTGDRLSTSGSLSVNKNGLVFSGGERALGVFVVGDSNTDCFSKNRSLQLKSTVKLGGMSKTVRLIPIIVSKDERSVIHTLAQIDCRYFDYEYSAVGAFAQDELLYASDRTAFDRSLANGLAHCFEAGTDIGENIGESADCVLFDGSACKKTPLFDGITVALPEIDYDATLPYGGFLQNGALCSDSGRFLAGALSSNYLCDGESYVEISDSGAVSFECKKSGGTVAIQNAFIAIGEGAVWSPTDYPSGAGKQLLVHEHAYSRFICAYNGCLCALNVFHASGMRSVIFDLEIRNESNCDRAIDVMCAFTPCVSMLPVRLIRRGSCVNVLSENDGTGMAFLSSRNITDRALYREGYRKYGKIDRASGFRSGGTTVAPAASVRVNIGGGKKERVIFCLSAKTDGLPFDCIDEKMCDMIFQREIEKYERLSDVSLLSSDKTLNNVFSFCAVRAYALGRRSEMTGGIDTHALRADKIVSLLRITGADKHKIGADILLSAAARYRMQDCSAAFKSIMTFADRLISGEIMPDAPTYALFRALVVEKLLGIKTTDGKIRIRPATCECTPHIEFDIESDGGKSHIVVTDGRNDGSWCMKIGRITYLSDTIKIGKHDLPIIMTRVSENGTIRN